VNRASVSPVDLPGNQPADRFYRGGPRIAAFRGTGAEGDRVPEDWVGSTTTLFAEDRLGLTTLPGGETLIDAISRDPISWLGAEHVTAYGADTKLLVKLLDAGERLPVHIHPSAEFAMTHLHAKHGKAEAWHILEGGSVHLGFSREVAETELRGWVESQDVTAMMAAMNQLEVNAGDTVFVPSGLPHAIGAGVFLIEAQEPEDMSVLLEWRGFDIDGPAAGHLGIVFDAALHATDRSGYGPAELQKLVVRAGETVDRLPSTARDFFRIHQVISRPTARLEASFSVIVVTSGTGSLTLADSSRLPVRRGSTVLMPHAAGPVLVSGDLTLVQCLPPEPTP
jgi:mannose-6-phosphate isomerase